MSDSFSISTVQRVREVFKNEPTKFVTAYVTTGILAVLIPGLAYAIRMARYRHSYYYAYVQGENSNAGERDEDYHDENNCHWFNVYCTPKWVNGNGNEWQADNGDDINTFYTEKTVPGWISGWGQVGSSQDGAAIHSSGGLKFVYAWQLLMFLSMLAYGSLILFKYRGNLAQSRIALQSLWLLIVFFGNFSFCSMWMLANGSIFTMGRELEEVGGFYHQFSVLMFTTDFWYCLWCIAYAIAVGRRIKNVGQAEFNATLGESPSEYMQYSEHGAKGVDIESKPSKTERKNSGVSASRTGPGKIDHKKTPLTGKDLA